MCRLITVDNWLLYFAQLTMSGVGEKIVALFEIRIRTRIRIDVSIIYSTRSKVGGNGLYCSRMGYFALVFVGNHVYFTRIDAVGNGCHCLHGVYPCRKMNTEAWDVFMTVSRDSGIVAAQCFEGPVRIVKCVMYLLFFTIVVCCTFASKASLLAMTTGAGDQNKV